MPSQDDLEKLLAQRDEIDRKLHQEHMRDVAVMFTDIVGSTKFFEEKGDIAGMAMVSDHDKLLKPIVAEHRGRVVKTIGDSIMAVFETDFADAVRCAAAMQRTLLANNEKRVAAGMTPIRIRIGVHAGKAMQKEGDYYGDVVNTAARVEHEAGGEEVVVSRSLYDAISGAGFVGKVKGAFEMKGKAEKVEVIAIDWRVAPAAAAAAAANGGAPEVFVLEIATGQNGLKVAALDGAADKGTVKAYAEVPIFRADLDAIASRFGTFMQGDGAGSYLDGVKKVGEELWRRGLSDRARERLGATKIPFLRMQLDDELVQIPWELMHDGTSFVGLKFAMGRLVSAKLEESPGQRRNPAQGGDALVVSNPSGDLPGAAREGETVAGLLKEGFKGGVRHISGPVTKAAFLKALQGCRILHFAGHAQHGDGKVKDGFRLADGIATAEEVVSAVGSAAPQLVFSNSCASSTSGGWRESARGVSGLAQALLLRGAQHYLAPMWDIPDDDALTFALRFYERVLAGHPFGEAVRHARELLASTPARPLSFAGYVLYGDPRTAFDEGSVKLTGPHRMRSGPLPVPVGAGTGIGLPGLVGNGAGKKSIVPFALAIGVAAFVVGFGSWRFVVSRSSQGGTTPTPLIANPVAPPGPTPAVPTPSPTPAVAGNPTPAPVRLFPRDGPIRVAVMPFKNLSGQKDLEHLREAMSEAVVTDFGQTEGVLLIERGQVDAEIGELEFEAGKYVDPETRSLIGKISGAEVVVMGGYQKAGKTIRAAARLVDAETGEILQGVKVEKPESKMLDLEDQLAREVSKAVKAVRPRLRK